MADIQTIQNEIVEEVFFLRRLDATLRAHDRIR